MRPTRGFDARIDLRLEEELKGAIEAAAGRMRVDTSTWLRIVSCVALGRAPELELVFEARRRARLKVRRS